MDPKRKILAVVFVFVTLAVAGFLIHLTWLGSTYYAMRDDGFFSHTCRLQHRLWLI